MMFRSRSMLPGVVIATGAVLLFGAGFALGRGTSPEPGSGDVPAFADVSGTPTAVALYQGPLFDGDRCNPYPIPVVDREWQVSAPRGIPGTVLPGEIVQIGLRNKFGAAQEFHYISARVVRPDGTSTTQDAPLYRDTWTDFLFPTDFAGAQPLTPGLYTVIWESQGGFLACDGFRVTAF
jgi:hypothetical protein